MKIMFLCACLISAVAFSFLSIIYSTGTIPFREPETPVQQKPAEKTDPFQTPTPHPSLIPGQETLDQLQTALQEARDLYLKKKSDLDAKAEEVAQQQALIADLKKEMETLRSQLEEKVVSLESGEQANLKALADVYARMEPASASALLTEMKPERSARVLRLIGDRQAAAILNETIAQGDRGAKIAAEWSDIIRRMQNAPGI
jgi:flagellar motility protein MotE (MotC chaperone)